MKSRSLPSIALVLGTVWGGIAAAQTAPTLPGSPASTGVVKPGPRLLSPIEQQQRAALPADVAPIQPVTPQVSAPIGRKPPPLGPEVLQPAPVPGLPASSATPAAMDVGNARCAAQVSELLRAECRARVAREAPVEPIR